MWTPASFLTYEAAWKFSEGMPCAKEIAMAKAWTGEAYQRTAAMGHQVLGGIGYTWTGKCTCILEGRNQAN